MARNAAVLLGALLTPLVCAALRPVEAAPAAAVVLAQLPPNGMEPDTDRPGLDYASFEEADPARCRERCDGDSRCRAWTFVRPHTTQGPRPRCWLKYAVPRPQPNPCCVSGQKLVGRRPREPRMESPQWDTNRPGGDYSNFNLPEDNPGLCQEECRRDPRCKAWTYVRPNVQGPWPRCWLKNVVPPTKQHPCCVSGTKAE